MVCRFRDLHLAASPNAPNADGGPDCATVSLRRVPGPRLRWIASKRWPPSTAKDGSLGYRKIAALMRAGGPQVTNSSVACALGRSALLLPQGFRADRKSWAVLRRKVFRDPPTARNRVWLTNFSEFETINGGCICADRQRSGQQRGPRPPGRALYDGTLRDNAWARTRLLRRTS